jgi:hypothetical protein
VKMTILAPILSTLLSFVHHYIIDPIAEMLVQNLVFKIGKKLISTEYGKRLITTCKSLMGNSRIPLAAKGRGILIVLILCLSLSPSKSTERTRVSRPQAGSCSDRDHRSPLHTEDQNSTRNR